MTEYYDQPMEQLFRVIRDLDTEEECRNFFEDICTIKEIQNMAQRLEAAILLNRGMGYQQISRQMGISTTTITRVSKCLNYGSGGYKMAIERLAETEEKK